MFGRVTSSGRLDNQGPLVKRGSKWQEDKAATFRQGGAHPPLFNSGTQGQGAKLARACLFGAAAAAAVVGAAAAVVADAIRSKT